VRLRTRSDRPTCRREIEKPGERDAEEQVSASRSSRTRFSLVAVDEAVVRVAFRLFCDTNPRLGVAWWCNNMGVFATLANVGWGSEFALRVRAAR
jgi:hypothetical protein